MTVLYPACKVDGLGDDTFRARTVSAEGEASVSGSARQKPIWQKTLSHASSQLSSKSARSSSHPCSRSRVSR